MKYTAVLALFAAGALAQSSSLPAGSGFLTVPTTTSGASGVASGTGIASSAGIGSNATDSITGSMTGTAIVPSSTSPFSNTTTSGGSGGTTVSSTATRTPSGTSSAASSAASTESANMAAAATPLAMGAGAVMAFVGMVAAL